MTFGDNLFCLLLLVLITATIITHITKSGEIRDGAGGGLQRKLHKSPSIQPLPPRGHAGFVSPSSPAEGLRKEQAGWNRIYGKTGPGGIRPEQFPCCPIDRQRNRKGCAQKIYWDRVKDCYVCSYGHHFSRNGRLC